MTKDTETFHGRFFVDGTAHGEEQLRAFFQHVRDQFDHDAIAEITHAADGTYAIAVHRPYAEQFRARIGEVTREAARRAN